MSVFLMVPFLAATGIYNPQVMDHGHCIAQSGPTAQQCLAGGVNLRSRSGVAY
jgi:hypothetical protein